MRRSAAASVGLPAGVPATTPILVLHAGLKSTSATGLAKRNSTAVIREVATANATETGSITT